MKRVITWLIVIIMIFGCWCPADSGMAESENVMASLSDTQRNSIGVLNYLAFLTMEIQSQKSNRLYLESAYSTLYNNTYMNAIDAVTLGQVKSLLTALNNFKMIAVKRERLEYIYEQNQAQAIKSAIPNPLSVMNIIQSDDWKKALVSVVYMAVDSVASYNASKSAADLEYLQSGWSLDDEEADVLHRGHLDSLDYMWEIIHDYDLPSDLAINEDDIIRFVNWKNNNNLIARIQFLESNREVYQAFGEYWLVLAESYYDHGDMAKCLDAVNCYEKYSTRIFRRDYHYAKVLPMAIAAAAEVYDNELYISEAGRFAERILANCDQEDWVLRYAAAETYVDLAGRTADDSYLQKAYDVALNNVNYLVQKQVENNETYLADIKLETVPAGSTKAKKTEIDTYNKGLKEARKVAVPPVSDALMLNSDLLFILAERLNITDSAKTRVDGILHGHSGDLFLNPFIDNLYRFDDYSEIDLTQIDITFTGKEIKIPARYLTENTVITVGGLNVSGKTFLIDDWTIKEVDRKNANDVSSFIATLTSKQASNFSYTAGSTVWINLNPAGDEHTRNMQITFSVMTKKDFLIPYTAFLRVD